jgi:hypothetical protein
VHAVGPDLEGQVWSVVEDERHAVVSTDEGGEVGPQHDGPGLQQLVSQLHHVDAAGDASLQELAQIGPVGRAQVQTPSGERVGGHSAARHGPDQLQAVALGQHGGGQGVASQRLTVALDDDPPRAEPQRVEEVDHRGPIR